MMHFISHGQRVPSLARRRDASTEPAPIRRVDAWINRFLISSPPPRLLGQLQRRFCREAAQSSYFFMLMCARGTHLDAMPPWRGVAAPSRQSGPDAPLLPSDAEFF
jgi:hypothetical protein